MTRCKREAAAAVLDLLEARYPEASCALQHRDPWQLLTATILSAQCTDVRVNMVTPALFAKYATAAALGAAKAEDVEAIIRSTGFFRQKAKSIIAMSQDLVDRFGGKVPETLPELTSLRGVGRKTANVIIGVAFGGAGVVVDTHVRRISRRLGWTKQSHPAKIEQELMALFPRERWTQMGTVLIWHGRDLCPARKPRCAECPVNELCPEGRKRLATPSTARP
ncbi:MAG: endonuclease III [Armatimonadetes bacterium]|nr:endonuclease III [Armatimonadota bacterium]MDE2207293.1 endonuclease III [Armatimonadota bacterium]